MEMLQPDPAFMLWASMYVALKWTIGVWAFRRVKAYVVNRHAATNNA
jgi:hypothetical protein